MATSFLFFFLLVPLTLRCSCMYFYSSVLFYLPPLISSSLAQYIPSPSTFPTVLIYFLFLLSHVPKIQKPAWCGDGLDGKRAFSFFAHLFCMHSFPHICIICLPRMPLGFVLIALNACVKCLACFSIVSDQIYLIRIRI